VSAERRGDRGLDSPPPRYRDEGPAFRAAGAGPLTPGRAQKRRRSPRRAPGRHARPGRGAATPAPIRGATEGWRHPLQLFVGLPIAQAALKFAQARHAGQYREIDHAPFIHHPIEVGWLLCQDGHSDEVIAAGLLHDVLEKTATAGAELERRFGTRITHLVESVSDDPSLTDYESRKRDLRHRVAQAGPETQAVFAADKIAKVRELALSDWRLRDSTIRARLTHYRASLEMLHHAAGELGLVDLLDAELERAVPPRDARLNLRTADNGTGSS
jgi:HD domain